MVVEFQRRRSWWFGSRVEQKWRCFHVVHRPAERTVLVRVESLEFHRRQLWEKLRSVIAVDLSPSLLTYFVDIFCRREEHRGFGNIAHRVEFRTFAHWVIQLIQFFPSRCRHLTFGRPPFLVPCFPLGTLKTARVSLREFLQVEVVYLITKDFYLAVTPVEYVGVSRVFVSVYLEV